jgi:beta-glucosidase
MVLGETRDMSGEAASRASLDLPGRQQELFDAVARTGRPIVVVVCAGRPLAIPRVSERAEAVVYAWFLGTEAGTAIVDVLLGDVNPSGRLPVTLPRSTGQVPIFYAQRPSGRPASDANRWSNRYADLAVGPQYPFGFGLGYTTFEYADLSLSAPAIAMDGRVDVAATIRNTGARDGDEVVQLYVRDRVASVSRPVRELKGFRRVHLPPGGTTRVSFTLTPNDLQFWGDGRWVVEPGSFTVWVAPDASRGLEGTFEIRSGERR